MSTLCGNGVSFLLAFQEALDINLRNLPITYLELPLATSVLHQTHFNDLFDKLSFLLEGWKSKPLSLEGILQPFRLSINILLSY